MIEIDRVPTVILPTGLSPPTFGLMKPVPPASPCVLQVERIEPFSEPPVDRSEQFASLLRLTLVTPEARKAHCGAEFPGLGLLLAGEGESALEIRFRFGSVRFGRIRAISPAMRLISASNHLSFVVSAAVIASPIQRQASSSFPSSA